MTTNSGNKIIQPLNNKKLVVQLDDINLAGKELQNLLMTITRCRRYFTEHCYREIKNITFIVAENNSFESKLEERFLKNFKYIDLYEIDPQKLLMEHTPPEREAEFRDTVGVLAALYSF